MAPPGSPLTSYMNLEWSMTKNWELVGSDLPDPPKRFPPPPHFLAPIDLLASPQVKRERFRAIIENQIAPWNWKVVPETRFWRRSLPRSRFRRRRRGGPRIRGAGGPTAPRRPRPTSFSFRVGIECQIAVKIDVKAKFICSTVQGLLQISSSP